METTNKKRNDIFLLFFLTLSVSVLFSILFLLFLLFFLSSFLLFVLWNLYRPVGQNISPQGRESVAPPKGNESDPSRPAGGRLAWSLPLRGPQAAYPRKNALPKGFPQPEKGVSGEEPLPPSGGPGGQRPLVLFLLLSPEKAGPATGSGPPEVAPPTVVAYGRQISAVENGPPMEPLVESPDLQPKPFGV